MTSGKVAVLAVSVALAALTVPVLGQNNAQFTDAQIKRGSDIYAQNCSPCHGPRMLDSQAPADLRKFPPDEKNRFVTSVTKGKNQMPPWGDLFKADDIDALWAYVMAGEKQ
jgi:mono/diheme cytochrome c family protein